MEKTSKNPSEWILINRMNVNTLCSSCEQNSKHDVGGNDDDYHHHAKSFPLFTLYNNFIQKIEQNHIQD